MNRPYWSALPVLILSISLAWLGNANSLPTTHEANSSAIVAPQTVSEAVHEGTFAQPRRIEEAAFKGAVFIDTSTEPDAYFVAAFDSVPDNANPPFPRAPQTSESWTYAGQHSGVGADLKPFTEPTREGALHSALIADKNALLVSKIDGTPTAQTPYPTIAQSNDFWEFVGLFDRVGSVQAMKDLTDLVWPGVYVKFDPGHAVYVALRTGYPVSDEWPLPGTENAEGYWRYAGTDSGIAVNNPRPWTERSPAQGALFQHSESALRHYFYTSTFIGFPVLMNAVFPAAGSSDHNWDYRGRHSGSAVDPVAFGEPTTGPRYHRARVQGKWAILLPRFQGKASASTPYPETLEGNEFWTVSRVSAHAGNWQDPRGPEYEHTWTSIGDIHAIVVGNARAFYRLISTSLPWDQKWDFDDTSVWQSLGNSHHAGTVADPKGPDEFTWPGAVHVTTIDGKPVYFASQAEGIPADQNFPLPTTESSNEHWTLIPVIQPIGTFDAPRRIEDYSQIGSVYVGSDMEGKRAFYVSRFEGYPRDDIDSFSVVGVGDSNWIYAGHHAGVFTDLKPLNEITRTGAIHESSIEGQRALLRSRFDGVPSSATPPPTTLASNDHWEFIDVFKNAGIVGDLKGRDDLTWPGALHFDEDQQLIFAATHAGKPGPEGWVYPVGENSDDKWTFIGSMADGTAESPRDSNGPSTPGTVFADQRGVSEKKLFRAKFTGFAADVGATFPTDSQSNQFYDFIGEHAGTFTDPKSFNEPTWPGAVHVTTIADQQVFLTSKIDGTPDANTPYPQSMISNEFWNVEFATAEAGTFADPKTLSGRTWPGAVHAYTDAGETWLATALQAGDPEADKWPSPATGETHWKTIGVVRHQGTFADPKGFDEATTKGLIHSSIVDGQTVYYRSLVHGVPAQHNWVYPGPNTHNEFWEYLGRNLPEGTWAHPKGTSGFTWPGRIHAVQVGSRNLYLTSRVDGLLKENKWPFPDAGENAFWSVAGESLHAGDFVDPKDQQEVTWVGAIHVKQGEYRMYYESLISANLADAANAFPLPEDYQSNDWWRYVGRRINDGTLEDTVQHDEVTVPGDFRSVRSVNDYYYVARFSGVGDDTHPTPDGENSNEDWTFIGKHSRPGTFQEPNGMFEFTSPGELHRFEQDGKSHYVRSKISGPPGPAGWKYPLAPQSNDDWEYVDMGVHAGTWDDPKPWTDNSWPGAIHEYKGAALLPGYPNRMFFKSRILGSPAKNSTGYLDSNAWELLGFSTHAGTLDAPKNILPFDAVPTWRGAIHLDPKTSFLVQARKSGRIGTGLEVELPIDLPTNSLSWTYLGTHKNKGTLAEPKEWNEYTWPGRIHRFDHDGKALYFSALSTGTPSENNWAYPTDESSNLYWAYIGNSTHAGTFSDPQEWNEVTWPGAIHRVERDGLQIYYSSTFSGNPEQMNFPYPTGETDDTRWKYKGTVRHAGTVIDPRTPQEPVWPGILAKSGNYYYTARNEGVPQTEKWTFPEGRESNDYWDFYGVSIHAGSREDPKEWMEVTWPGAIHRDVDTHEVRLYVSLKAGVPSDEGWVYPSGWHGNNWWAFDSALPAEGTYDKPLGWNSLTAPGLIHMGMVKSQPMHYVSKFAGYAKPPGTPEDEPGKEFPDGALDNQWWEFKRKGMGTESIPNVWGDYSRIGDINSYYYGGGRFIFRAKQEGRPSSGNWYYPTAAVDNKYWEYLYRNEGTLESPKDWDELTYPEEVHRYEYGDNVLYFRSKNEGNPARHNWYYPTRPADNDNWTFIGLHAGTWQDPKSWSEPTWPGAIHEYGNVYFISKVTGNPADHNWYYPTTTPVNDHWQSIATSTYTAPGINDLSRPFDQYTWVTAHNAYRDNMTDLVNRGVRGFMIDIHMAGETVRVCHSNDDKCGDNDTSLKSTLENFIVFLERNRNAVITIIFESTVKREKMLEVLKQVPGLQKYVSATHYDGTWPTLQSMINSNKRLVLFSDGESNGIFTIVAGNEEEGKPPVNIVVEYNMASFVENTYDLGETILIHNWTCKSRHQDVDLSLKKYRGSRNRLFVLNQFHSWGSSAVHAGDMDNNLTRLQQRVEDDCGEPSGRRKPNYLAIDFTQAGDGFPYAAALSQGGIYFYEQNNANRDGDTTCVLPGNQPTDTDGVQYRIRLPSNGCENDEIRSMDLEGIRAGTRIELWDSPSGDHQDDFTIIDVKQSIPMGKRVRVDTLEGNSDTFYYRKKASRNNGLDGRVSRIVVARTPPEEDIGDAQIVFYEGGGGTQNIVCTVPFDKKRQFQMGSGNNSYGCDNDEISSAIVLKAGRGSTFSVHGKPDGSDSQGKAKVTFKRGVEMPVTIGSFNSNYESGDIKVEVSGGGNLNGKISYAYFDPQSQPEPDPEPDPEPEPDPGAPPAPGSVRFENQWHQPLKIMWDTSPRAVKYRVYKWFTKIAETSDTHFSVSSTDYSRFHVRAVDSEGRLSPLSNYVFFYPDGDD
jgi:hypothetical protein